MATKQRYADIIIGTHNVGDHPETGVVNALFAKGARVVNLQEVADKSPGYFDLPGWVGRYWPAFPPGQRGPSQNVDENPILWDKRLYRCVGHGSRRLTDHRHVGEAGPGPAVTNIKWLNWVTLESKEHGFRFVDGNMHTTPGILRNKARAEAMRDQIAGAVKWADHRPDHKMVVLNGDLNADLRRAREDAFLRPLWQAGFESAWEKHGPKGGSMDRRGIDHTMLREHDEAQIVSMEVLQRLGYDHRPVLTVVRRNLAA